MRYQTGHAEVLAEGFVQQSSAKIAASGKAFKGLIDGVYSRKIEAPVRELATNAFDSHMAAGTLVPFEVHVPSTLEPTFYVRDFGTGISHDYMMNRFPVAFDSTKDGLNAEDASLVSPDNQVGCLGLGRLSFFAYTDSCTITVWQAGTMRVYTMFMGGDGVPQIAFAGEAPSDEPSGVKVEYAAKKKDFEAFRNAAIRVFKGFPIPPTGLPEDVRTALAIEPTEIGSFWKAYPKDYLPGGGFYARQGCVLYPIELAQIDESAVEEEDEDGDATGVVTLSERFARFKGVELTVVIDFPIGSLEFDLSRERLAYTEGTVRNLRGRWAVFQKDLDQIIVQHFATQARAFDRMLTAHSSLFTGLGPLFAGSGFMAEAEKIERYIHKLLPTTRSNRTSAHSFVSVLKRSSQFTDYSSVTPYYGTRTYDGPAPHWCRDAIFLYMDEESPKNANRRVNHYLHAVGKKYAFVFAEGGLTAERWKKMGQPPIVRMSEVPAIPKKPKAERAEGEYYGGGGVFDRVKVVDGASWRAPKEDEDTSEHLFAFLHRGILFNPDPTRYPDLTALDVCVLHHLSLATGGPAISFINTRSNDKPGKFDHLPLFYDMLDKFAERFDKHQIGDAAAILNHSRFCTSRYAKALAIIDGGGKIKDASMQTPLTKLGKQIRGRYGKVDGDFRANLGTLLLTDRPALVKIRNDLIHLATQFGIMVLPENAPTTGKMPYPLLSPKWERYVDRVLQTLHSSGNHGSAMRHYRALLIKEILSC